MLASFYCARYFKTYLNVGDCRMMFRCQTPPTALSSKGDLRSLWRTLKSDRSRIRLSITGDVSHIEDAVFDWNFTKQIALAHTHQSQESPLNGAVPTASCELRQNLCFVFVALPIIVSSELQQPFLTGAFDLDFLSEVTSDKLLYL